MENNTVHASHNAEEMEINLKEIILYVCSKWRMIILLGLIGLVLGFGVGMQKSKPANTELDLSKVNTREIERYTRLLQMYDDLVAWNQESIYLNMDPQDAYAGKTEYILQIPENTGAMIAQMYQSVLSKNEDYEQLMEASGLNCTLRDAQELVRLSCFGGTGDEQSLEVAIKNTEKTMNISLEPRTLSYGNTALRVAAEVTAPEQAACQAMLDVLDRKVQDMNAYVAANYGVTVKERLVSPAEKKAYHMGIAEAKQDAVAQMEEYSTALSALGKKLTAEDKLYMSGAYKNEQPAGRSKSTMVKWALIVGILFGMFGVAGYASAFLMDGHVRSLNELMVYDLHPVAVLEESRKRRMNALDRVFLVNRRYHSAEYVAQALEAMEEQHIVLCGDLGDSDIARYAGCVGEMNGKVAVKRQMIEDAQTQLEAKQADGVILMVHLWKTQRKDLEQEIRICRKIGCRVLGVVVIG